MEQTMIGKSLNGKCRLIIAAVTLMVVMGACACPAQEYDVAAFYWPSLHYDERWATFFRMAVKGSGKAFAIASPNGRGTGNRVYRPGAI